MRKRIHSLQVKLTLSFVVLVLAVSGLTFAFTFRATKTALHEGVRGELGAIAAVIATQLDGAGGDTLAALQPGQEDTPAFLALRDKLRVLRGSHEDLKYIYTMRKHGDAVEFLVDAEYGNPTDPGAEIHEPYKAITPLLAGPAFERPVVETESYVDKWGTLLSGYHPVRDSSGKIVGIVGVDMTLQRVLEKEHVIGNSIFIIMGAGILFAGLLILVFSKTIIRDIKHLNDVANLISMGDMSATVHVRRNDEIGELADSFGRLVTSLKIMTAEEPVTPEEG